MYLWPFMLKANICLLDIQLMCSNISPFIWKLCVWMPDECNTRTNSTLVLFWFLLAREIFGLLATLTTWLYGGFLEPCCSWKYIQEYGESERMQWSCGLRGQNKRWKRLNLFWAEELDNIQLWIHHCEWLLSHTGRHVIHSEYENGRRNTNLSLRYSQMNWNYK